VETGKNSTVVIFMSKAPEQSSFKVSRKKERKKIIIIIIIIRNGAKTISLQTLFGRLNYANTKNNFNSAIFAILKVTNKFHTSEMFFT
jgi:uncharacterized membrane protein